MASVIAETRLQATDDFRFEAPPGNGRFLSQPTMKLLRQPQTDHPMSRPPLHQGKASNASPKGNPDNQAGNGGKGDGHGDTCTKPSVAEYLMTLAASYLELAERALRLREPVTAVRRQHIKVMGCGRDADRVPQTLNHGRPYGAIGASRLDFRHDAPYRDPTAWLGM
jgi:hypothetical protein